jgi:ABC-2 type transport system ATP-binding protein
MANALTIRGLKKTYATGTSALKGVSLDIPEGDFFALLGPNGAGKTTLIGIATGLVNKSEGTVSVFEYDIDKDPERAKAHIGLVGQEINFNPFEKPIDIVVNQGGYYGIPRSVAVPRAKQLLTDLGLGEKMSERAMALSGGMKRRLMIARALIHKPRFLVLDEPTAGVDVELRRGMWEYLRTLTSEGVTILLTTHYLEEAEQLAHRVAIIARGEIVAHGTMDEILALHDGENTGKPGEAGYRGGRLEEVFLKLTSSPKAHA